MVTTLLEIIESKTLLRQQSHFAFRITRLMRRRSFCWALRESKKTVGEDLGILAIEAGFTSNVNLESVVILRKFLAECLQNRWLTPAELELLMLFKLEGVGAEVLAMRTGISEIAFRHRMQRLIERLRRVAKRPSPIVPRKSCSTDDGHNDRATRARSLCRVTRIWKLFFSPRRSLFESDSRLDRRAILAGPSRA